MPAYTPGQPLIEHLLDRQRTSAGLLRVRQSRTSFSALRVSSRSRAVALTFSRSAGLRAMAGLVSRSKTASSSSFGCSSDPALVFAVELWQTGGQLPEEILRR